MAKGTTCPNCGNQTFAVSKTARGVRECSVCQVVGWFGEPGATGGGKGATCRTCGSNTLHTIHKSAPTIRWCSNRDCHAVVVTAA